MNVASSWYSRWYRYYAKNRPFVRRLPALWAVVTGVLGALLLAAMGGWLWTGKHLWSFSHLVFVPDWLRWGVALVCLSMGLLAYWFDAERWRARLGHTFLPLARVNPYWAVPMAGAIFWALREHTWYGDALLKLELHHGGSIQDDPYVWKEPLDSLAAYGINALLHPWGVLPETGIAITSVIAGMIFVAALIYWVRALRPDPFWVAVLIVGIAGTGSSQLWFGHVENYSWVTAWLFVTLALATAHVRGELSLWPVGLAAGIAVSFHPQAAFGAVGLLALLTRRSWAQQIGTLALTGAVAPLLTFTALKALGVPFFDLAEGFAGDDQLFWRLDQALAPAILIDALDNLWLIAPLFPLWLVMGVWGILLGGLARDRLFRLYTVTAAGLLLYHFSFQNDLPRPDDWDLFAIVGPGITVWGLYATMMVARGLNTPVVAKLSLHALLLPGLVFAVIFTGIWVGVNHSHTLIRPVAAQREFYARYRWVDLVEQLPQAHVAPDAPICPEPVGCERVAETLFVMPHTGDARATLFAHAPAHVSFAFTLPDEPLFLWVSPALDPEAWDWGGDGVTFQVVVEQAGAQSVLWSAHFAPDVEAHRDWQEVFVALDAYQGQQIVLHLITLPGPAGDDTADRAGWGMPWLMQGNLDLRFE